MIIPPIQGEFRQNRFFIYVAADREYFEKFGKTLINSVERNTNYGIHLHLYNPTPEQLEFCRKRSCVSVTWEELLLENFNDAVKFWSQDPLPEPYNGRRLKMLGMKQFADSDNLVNWIHKTYYACMRFVRLAEFLDQPTRFLEIDIDGIVRSEFSNIVDDNSKDFYLYQKDKGGHLAGAILYNNTPNSFNFVKELAHTIRTEIEKDNIYWFLDQHSLDNVIVKYNKGLLPISYVDWHMRPESSIWSAKGKRKELAIFKQEQAKYL
jgi:hypothetical protein